MNAHCTLQYTEHYPNLLYILFYVSDERAFRLHAKRVVENFTKNVVDAAERELPVETANRIKSVSDITMNLIRPEIIRFVSKFNSLIDKHLSIPPELPMSDEAELQNTADMDSYELQCKKDIEELELVYKQQAVMINHLKAELDLYDNDLMAEAETDLAMCDLFEENFGEFGNSMGSSNSIGNECSDITVFNVLEHLNTAETLKN